MADENEKEETVIDETLEVAGSLGGWCVGMVAGAVGATAKLISSHGDLKEARQTFEEVGSACIDEGAKIGRKHGWKLATAALSLYGATKHKGNGGSNT